MANDELADRRKRKKDLEDEIDGLDDKLVSLRNMITQRMNSSRDEGEKTAFTTVIGFMHHLGLWSRGNND